MPEAEEIEVLYLHIIIIIIIIIINEKINVAFSQKNYKDT